jgi:hypothetical protein
VSDFSSSKSGSDKESIDQSVFEDFKDFDFNSAKKSL